MRETPWWLIGLIFLGSVLAGIAGYIWHTTPHQEGIITTSEVVALFLLIIGTGLFIGSIGFTSYVLRSKKGG